MLRAIDFALSQVSNERETPAKEVKRKIVVVIGMRELLRLVTMQRYVRRIEAQNNLCRWLCVATNEGIPEQLVCVNNRLAVLLCIELIQGLCSG